MEYLTWGQGPKTVLFLQAGPGSNVPSGFLRRRLHLHLAAFVRAGYQPWVLTRRRHMPDGHSMADMADDCAAVIAEHFAGHVDLVVGESYGGCIALYVAARHSALVGGVAVVGAAARSTAEGIAIDRRMATALAGRDARGAGEAFAEYVFASQRLRPVRRVVGLLLGPGMLAHDDCPPRDVLVEFAAEEGFDCQDELGQIGVPVLLVCGDRDRFFPVEYVEQTAAAIADSRLVWLRGRGHLRTLNSRRVARHVLEFSSGG